MALCLWLFAHPESGKSQWLLFPSVNVEIFTLALEQFAQAVGASPTRHIMLVLDRAGWHKSKNLVTPEGIRLVFLPAYSPESQPCERLWPLCNEALANRYFQTLDELQEVQAERCVVLQNDLACLRRATLFRWWPALNENLLPTKVEVPGW